MIAKRSRNPLLFRRFSDGAEKLWKLPERPMVAEEEHIANIYRSDIARFFRPTLGKYPHRYPQNPEFAPNRYKGAIGRLMFENWQLNRLFERRKLGR